MQEEKNKGNKAGRKGMYRDWISPEGLIKIEGWARDGLSNKQIAQNIGIREGTIYEWIKNYPEFSEALKKGKEVIDREVENALLKRALGYQAEETKTYVKDDGNGKKNKHVEKVKKHLAGDVTAMIFWLKNRKPEEWRDRKETELSGYVDNNINAVKGLTTEELKELAKRDTTE